MAKSRQAGGLATTGTKRILDIIPNGIHERCPVFLGSREDVSDLMKFYTDAPKENGTNGTTIKENGKV